MEETKTSLGFYQKTDMDTFKRLRRLRMTESLRSMVRETELSINDFIYPLFVVPGKGVRKEVKSMPGVFQLSVDETVKECREVRSLRIPAVILFGIPEHKDEVGSEAYDANGIVQRAIRAIKKDVPELTVITDVCLCEYTSHGHCGIVRGEEIVNDESIELLAKEAHTRRGRSRHGCPLGHVRWKGLCYSKDS
jgi:porphobilinogen synthase